ncbi:MAG: polysaccharide deacetylase family protein [Verrucomicrobiae bacterium]|nr:polysaccharide deacetylase family protein [Verrucomicrobiae bacterium]
MNQTTTRLVKAALGAAHMTGADRWLAPYARGRGVIFMLHHVHPEPPAAFEPNRILKVTPAFLEAVIGEVRASGFETVSLDKAAERLASPFRPDEQPFACFTLDDGYRDNLEHAYPVFARNDVPFTVYVATDYADGAGDLWWLTLERVVRDVDEITVSMDGAVQRFPAATIEEKYTAFERIYWWLRTLPEFRAREVVADLARSIGCDTSRQCASLVMSWDEVRRLAADPLVTIGAHTRRHLALAKLSSSEAMAEIQGSMARVSDELGRPCRHFSYPYGCAASAGEREFILAREAGAVTATTTRKGVLLARHANRLTALPRVSLNGDYQDLRYVRVMLSGAPFALLQAMGHS